MADAFAAFALQGFPPDSGEDDGELEAFGSMSDGGSTSPRGEDAALDADMAGEGDEAPEGIDQGVSIAIVPWGQLDERQLWNVSAPEAALLEVPPGAYAVEPLRRPLEAMHLVAQGVDRAEGLDASILALA